jgi:hypothetical protein
VSLFAVTLQSPKIQCNSLFIGQSGLWSRGMPLVWHSVEQCPSTPALSLDAIQRRLLPSPFASLGSSSSCIINRLLVIYLATMYQPLNLAWNVGRTVRVTKVYEVHLWCWWRQDEWRQWQEWVAVVLAWSLLLVARWPGCSGYIRGMGVVEAKDLATPARRFYCRIFCFV